MNKKILICDDQELIREVLSGFLKSKGFQVTSVATSQESFQQLSQQNFDAIILDVNMPGSKQVEAHKGAAQVVLISGQVPENITSPFFRKPFSLHAIFEHLKSMTSRQASKILVVDDQDFLREMLSDYLKKQGFEIHQAKNGQEAFDLTLKQKFDGILMDVRMPELDGLWALRQMQDAGVKAPVILMSGFGDVCSLEDAQALGAIDFLPKPFKLEAASLALAGI